MPLYEYLCSACAHRDTLLEKLSSPRRKKCPACGKRLGFERQLSAPAFHLKGSGWYATDFRNNGKQPPAADAKQDAPADKADGQPKTQPDKAAQDKAQPDKAAQDKTQPDKTQPDKAQPAQAARDKPAASATARRRRAV